MSCHKFDKVDTKIDILKEIGNIGSGNAITSFSKLLNKKFEMKVPGVKILESHKLSEIIGGPENLIVSVLTNVSSKEVNGMIMFIVEEKYVKLLIDTLFTEYKNNIKYNENIDNMRISALCELGNILISSYLSAISDLLNIKLNYSISNICIDMAGAILSVPAIEFTEMYDKLLFIETIFIADNKNISGYFIFIPDLKSLKFISSHVFKT